MNMDTDMNRGDRANQVGSKDRLPFLDMKIITRKSLDKAEKGKAIYTPGGFYKLARVASKCIPSAVMIKIVKKRYVI